MNSITKLSPTKNKNVINHTNSTKKTQSSSHRAPSFSSTSSFSSSNSSSSYSSSFRSSSLEEDYFSLPNIPSTSSGIPFSWETIPGIPKKQTLKKIDSSRKLPNSNNFLPLPPPVKYINQKKHYITRRDPFFDALVECSKGGDADDNKDMFGGSIWKPCVKSLSARFGVVNMSCKNSSSVAQSLVFLPRGGPRRISYDVLKKSSG